MHSLTPSEAVLAADGLADTPENCIARHALRSGRGRAFMLDGADTRRALVIDPSVTPGELLAFGDNLPAIGELLGGLRGWNVVEVAPAIADELAERLAAGSHATIDRMRDLYFTLSTSPAPFEHPSVRATDARRSRPICSKRPRPSSRSSGGNADLARRPGHRRRGRGSRRLHRRAQRPHSSDTRTSRSRPFPIAASRDCAPQPRLLPHGWRSRWD